MCGQNSLFFNKKIFFYLNSIWFVQKEQIKMNLKRNVSGIFFNIHKNKWCVMSYAKGILKILFELFYRCFETYFYK